MEALFPVEVERFAVPAESGMGIFLDDLGMLSPPGLSWHGDGGLTGIRALASAGSFSLLGEPGAGKTTALRSLIKGIPGLDAAGPGQDAVLVVSLAEITARAAFREMVTGPVLARIPAGAGGAAGRLTLMLDGLDECPLPGGARAFAGLLREMLTGADTAALRVLISCRSADYPPVVHELLTEALGSFTSYELAPLSRADIADLAASRDVEPAAFLSEVSRSRTGPLACLPLSLDVLVRHYLATDGLHGPPAQLYETALVGLAGEPDRGRDPALRSGSREQILAVGARLCCYLLLCGRAAFWTEPPDLMPPGYLEPSGLAGGEEHQTGGPFAVTTGLVDAALHSALFTTRGPGRRGPAHATFAAYLAARHLAALDLPDPQLRSLLTAGTGTGSGVIPALRETAAWLLAVRPDRPGWLTEPELASLAVHAAVIDDPQIRRVFTERLLADPRLMLRGTWRHSWNLVHPGLAVQLAPVLEALADPGAPQPGRDQSYVALTLAREAGTAGLMPSLLEIAARPDLVPWLRAQAMRAAAHIDADAAAPVLTGVLAEITAHPDRDPDDEIRGIALTALWPAHLPVQDLVTNLTRPRRDNFLGAYFIFRRDLPGRLSDDDVPHLLAWAVRAAARKELDGDDDLIPGLLDRAFTCDMTAVIGPVGDLVAAQLRAYRTLAIPAALDERDEDGAETGTSRDLRRRLAAELLGRHADAAGQLAIWGWQPSAAVQRRHADAVRRGTACFPPARRGLVDAADLPWLLQLARAAGPGTPDGFIPLLRAVFDPLDAAAREAAWQTQATWLWSAFESWFDPVVLGSETAALQRRVFEASRPRPAGWDGAAAHAARVLDLYEAASGDTSAFEELLQRLQIDPVTGRGGHSYRADLAARPGIRLLPPGWEGRLGEAAWNYLHQPAPPGPDLLDRPGRLPWPAEAGYLALAHLVRHEAPGRTLAMLDGPVLARWAAPILAWPDVRGTQDGGGTRQVLLTRLAQVAPDDLPGLISKLAAGHLASGSWPAGLEALDPVCTDPIGDVLARHLRAVTGAMAATLASRPGDGQPGQHLVDQRLLMQRYTITVLVRILARCGHAAGIQAAHGIIAEATAPGAGEALVLAARAAAAGLATGAARHWREVTGQLSGTPSLLRAVLRDLGEDTANPFTAGLADSELAGLWNLLKQFWPYPDDDALWTSGAVSADQQAQHWRDGVLETLVMRGTRDSADLLEQLAESNPELPWLADQARRAQELHRQQDWAPLSPGDLTRLVRDSGTRLVRDIAELTAVVLEALDTLQEQALWSHGWSMLLWNRADEAASGGWWPAWEDTLSNFICAFLREHLAGRKPVINREVEIQPRHIDGARTDIHVQASDPRDSAPEPLTVIIEVKGCWNTEIRTGISGQLIPYLQPHPGWAGIFLVGYFHHPGGEHPSYTGTPGRSGPRGRHRAPRTHTPDQVLGDLQRQIADARPGNITRARVLRFSLSPPPASGPAAPQT